MVGRSGCVSPGLWIPDCGPVIRMPVPETGAITCVRDDRYHPPPAASAPVRIEMAHDCAKRAGITSPTRTRERRNRGKWCGREDSNFHGLAATTTSTLRVYQFRHDRTHARVFPGCIQGLAHWPVPVRKRRPSRGARTSQAPLQQVSESPRKAQEGLQPMSANLADLGRSVIASLMLSVSPGCRRP